MWVLKRHTRVLVFTRQALYKLSHLLIPLTLPRLYLTIRSQEDQRTFSLSQPNLSWDWPESILHHLQDPSKPEPTMHESAHSCQSLSPNPSNHIHAPVYHALLGSDCCLLLLLANCLPGSLNVPSITSSIYTVSPNWSRDFSRQMAPFSFSKWTEYFSKMNCMKHIEDRNKTSPQHANDRLSSLAHASYFCVLMHNITCASNLAHGTANSITTDLHPRCEFH